jgi:hypothetical protein
VYWSSSLSRTASSPYFKGGFECLEIITITFHEFEYRVFSARTLTLAPPGRGSTDTTEDRRGSGADALQYRPVTAAVERHTR